MNDLDVVKDNLSTLVTAVDLVDDFFKDEEKTMLWFNTPNPLLGNITPRYMIRIGRTKKLLNFIRTQLSENEVVQ